MERDTLGNSDSEWIRWSGGGPEFVHLGADRPEHRERGYAACRRQARAGASGVNPLDPGTVSPNALAPQASHGFDETNRTSRGATPKICSISAYAPGSA